MEDECSVGTAVLITIPAQAVTASSSVNKLPLTDDRSVTGTQTSVIVSTRHSCCGKISRTVLDTSARAETAVVRVPFLGTDVEPLSASENGARATYTLRPHGRQQRSVRRCHEGISRQPGGWRATSLSKWTIRKRHDGANFSLSDRKSFQIRPARPDSAALQNCNRKKRTALPRQCRITIESCVTAPSHTLRP